MKKTLKTMTGLTQQGSGKVIEEKVFLEDKPILAWLIIIISCFLAVYSTIVAGDFVSKKVQIAAKPDNAHLQTELEICQDKCFEKLNRHSKLSIDQCEDMCEVLYYDS